MAIPLGFSPLLALLFVCAIGGLFTVAAAIVARRFGRRALLPLWIGGSIALGAAGTFRNLAIQRQLGLSLARINVPGLYSLLIVATLVVLAVPTAALNRRLAGDAMPRAAHWHFVAGLGWTFGGVLLTLVVALILDLANIPFIPIH